MALELPEFDERVSRRRNLASRKKEKETTERHQDPVSQIQRKGESKTYRMKEKEKSPKARCR